MMLDERTNRLFLLAERAGMTKDDLHRSITVAFGHDSVEGLTDDERSRLCQMLSRMGRNLPRYVRSVLRSVGMTSNALRVFKEMYKARHVRDIPMNARVQALQVIERHGRGSSASLMTSAELERLHRICEPAGVTPDAFDGMARVLFGEPGARTLTSAQASTLTTLLYVFKDKVKKYLQRPFTAPV